MDPNETLQRLRGWADYVGDASEEDAIALFLALDDWITKGGFYPADWDRSETNRPPF